MLECKHSIGLKYFNEQDHSPLTQVPLEKVDWQPAAEAAAFKAAVERGTSSAVLGLEQIQIVPEWHPEAGQPYVSQFRFEVSRPGEKPFVKLIPASYFDSLAMDRAQALIKDGQLEETTKLRYRVCAYPKNGKAALPKEDDGAVVEEVPLEIQFHPGDLSELESRATVLGPVAESDLKVFFPQSVIEEVTRITLAADTEEVGGILLGRFHRDQKTKEVFLEITAQVKAPHVVSEKTSVRFTAQTWAAVRNVIRLRRSDEEYVAWWHNHPAKYWCNKECSPEAKKNCPYSQPFFSDKDRLVHRVTFPRAYSVALLCTNTFTGPRFSLYGWKDGVLSERGFHVLDAASPIDVSDNSSAFGGTENAEPCE